VQRPLASAVALHTALVPARGVRTERRLRERRPPRRLEKKPRASCTQIGARIGARTTARPGLLRQPGGFEGGFPRAVRKHLNSNSHPTLHGPNMRGSRVDLDATTAATTYHPNENDNLFVRLEELLRLKSKGVEGVDVARRKSLNAWWPRRVPVLIPPSGSRHSTFGSHI
jgi:hypothetical protein